MPRKKSVVKAYLSKIAKKGGSVKGPTKAEGARKAWKTKRRRKMLKTFNGKTKPNILNADAAETQRLINLAKSPPDNYSIE